MEESTFERPTQASYTYDGSRRGKSKLKFFAIILIILGILGLATAFVLGAFGGQTEDVVEITPTPTEFVFPTDPPTPTERPEPTASATATPKVSPSVDKTTGLNKASLTVEVQNGSGTAGAASKMADFLKDLGYTVSTIGNADNFEYEDVSVLVKSTKSQYLNLLKKDLATQYTVGSSSASLSASSSADAVVIIGE